MGDTVTSPVESNYKDAIIMSMTSVSGDFTYCSRGDECANRINCERYLTKEMEEEAIRLKLLLWFGDFASCFVKESSKNES
jgi:hypothetical protein